MIFQRDIGNLAKKILPHNRLLSLNITISLKNILKNTRISRNVISIIR